jgi:hypothetical protein
MNPVKNKKDIVNTTVMDENSNGIKSTELTGRVNKIEILAKSSRINQRF